MSRPRASMRHRSREAALQVLYAVDVASRGHPPDPSSTQEAFESVARHFELPEAARAFAWELVLGVSRHRETLDDRLSACARNWRIDRMAAVDRNVLRIAAYEMLCAETAAEIAIDEAIELARRFGGEGSPSFVNGVLDALARDAATEHARPEEWPS